MSHYPKPILNAVIVGAGLLGGAFLLALGTWAAGFFISIPGWIGLAPLPMITIGAGCWYLAGNAAAEHDENHPIN